MVSCDTGSKPDGFAQQLADRLRVPVLAPNKRVFPNPYQDKLEVAGFKIDKITGQEIINRNDMGEWILLLPKNE